MEILIAQEVLTKVLTTVLHVIPARTTFPVLSNILLETEDGKIRVSGTDLDVAVTTQVEAEIKRPGAITLPARRLGEIARELPKQPVRIVCEGEQAEIICHRSKFRVSGMAKEEYPELPPLPTESGFRVPGSLIERTVNKVAFAVAGDEARPALCGALCQIAEGTIRLVATDGHRLALVERKGLPGLPKKLEAIVPRKALTEVIRVLDPESEVEIRVDSGRIGIYLGETSITARLIEGPFPDYRQVIPKENPNRVRVEAGELTAALRRVAIFSSPHTHLVRMSLGGEGLELFAATPDIGEAREKVACEYGGEDMDVGYNASYLLEILRNVGSDQVQMSLSTPLSAGLVTPEEQEQGEELLYLLMPIRLSEAVE
ncbi:hypothetical protein AMJ39_03140 [candidate division TA06 bacterium DG_24]|uniref:Beta sliding clamp n=3 Tax=Bacteria division TA06 TaxID=1156500 RepID=A0A0S8J8W9_UNCT6|nr:MAG: hypothetical protein AMJ39_03140 [candidate division TA06 bacterium DG_24]KPK70758.1 MAG: hypothetical protein AMJ82_02360 [candidate division TA06 bacterium SM23_40]KPL05936.1 MAG: hypothetical protein AMJ71_10390 [candidate division TA06 bacterium SM1_40]